jgi:hypothetical protein
VNRLRSNVVNGHLFNRITLYGERGALLENLTLFLLPDRTWLYDDFGFKDGIEGFENFDATFQLRGGWKVQGVLRHEFVKFQDSSYAGYTSGSPDGPAYLPPEDYDGVNWTAQVTTPTWQQLGADVSYIRGRAPLFQEGATGTMRQLTGRLELRPAATVRITASGTVLHLFRLDESEFARAIIPRLRTEYQPNRALFFRVIGEYRSERRSALVAPDTGEPLYIEGAAQPAIRTNQFRVDLLASYEPTPGTVAFVGYGSSMETEEDFDWSGLERVSDGFFVKLAYRIRR